MAVTVMLTEEATKQTSGQKLEVLTPHQVRPILETSYLWITGTAYQVPAHASEISKKLALS